MATVQLTEADRLAAARSMEATKAVRAFKRQIDLAVNELAARVGALAADKMMAAGAVGGDSTRPHFTEDVRAYNAQLRRFEALLAAVKAC